MLDQLRAAVHTGRRDTRKLLWKHHGLPLFSENLGKVVSYKSLSSQPGQLMSLALISICLTLVKACEQTVDWDVKHFLDWSCHLLWNAIRGKEKLYNHFSIALLNAHVDFSVNVPSFTLSPHMIIASAEDFV